MNYKLCRSIRCETTVHPCHQQNLSTLSNAHQDEPGPDDTKVQTWLEKLQENLQISASKPAEGLSLQLLPSQEDSCA